MKNYKYLIVGGGMTADAAAKGIRELDQKGSIAFFSMEVDPPYKRPLLTKGLWKDKPFDSVWRHTEQTHAEEFLGCKIVSLDPARLTLQDDAGNEYHGEKILLATGGTPRHLPFNSTPVNYFRTLEDYRRLREATETEKEFTVIGGGFIGSEIAAALAMNNKKVTMLFMEEGIGARVYPHAVSQFLNDFYRQKGVQVLPNEQLARLSTQGKRQVVTTKGGQDILGDGIIAGLGIELNLDLARSTGLQVGNGIVVNDYLLTSHADIYAAGDVAEFYNPALDKRLRLEHEDNAVSMGRQAGRNMAGAGEPFHYLPYFYSDLFELGYEAVGTLDSRLKTATDWAEPFKKGVIYYFQGERICGVLLWNVWDKVPAARELIAQPGPFKAEELDAKKSPSWKITY